jgi:hypothetical protein
MLKIVVNKHRVRSHREQQDLASVMYVGFSRETQERLRVLPVRKDRTMADLARDAVGQSLHPISAWNQDWRGRTEE